MFENDLKQDIKVSKLKKGSILSESETRLHELANQVELLRIKDGDIKKIEQFKKRRKEVSILIKYIVSYLIHFIVICNELIM